MVDLSRILVTGADGMIGQSIQFGIKKNHSELDILNVNEIKKICNLINPSAILCLSSLNLATCEKSPIEAYNVNVIGVYNLAQEAKKRQIPIAIISSGAVFNGDKEKIFNEEDIPNPINIYGQTKYLAEIIVQNITEKHIIIRTGWLFGFQSTKKSSLDKILNSIRENIHVQVNSIQYGSPTYLPDFILSLKEILQSDNYGIIHISNNGYASAEDFTQEAIHYLKSSSNITILPISNINIPKRSNSEVLSSDKIKLRSWKEALHEYLNKK